MKGGEDIDEPVALYRHEALAVILQVRALAAGHRLCVLVWRRQREPFAGAWALPSGPVAPGETIGGSVRRHLATKVDLAGIAHLEQLRTLSQPGRDPTQRTIATAYLGLVPSTSERRLPDHAEWMPVRELPAMAFDHAGVVAEGVARMRAKLSYTNIAFALAPAEFSLAELRDIYVEALDHDVAVTNLQRILVRRGQLEPTGGHTEPGEHGGRPARLYRFTARELAITDPFAVLKPQR